MRWPIYFILAYFAVALQIGIGGHFRVWGAVPNLVMIAVVFIALHAPRDAALLGCFALGIMQDLTTADPSRLGLYGLAYGLFALMIGGYGTPQVRGNPIMHIVLTLMCGIVTAFIVLLHGWLHRFTDGIPMPISTMLWSAVYTSLLSPLILVPLNRLRRLFAFEPPRRRMRMG
ncbi:MAG: rod shape-determining protein MreD [Anaerolineae bacterium]|nr:rod shape-determining protein MreD [Phycisphaerae bacterium]